MDLRKCIVFFDEMDALAQTREGGPKDEKSDPLDVTRLLLTTSMLPKLADLWEQAGVVFLMATNHKRHLDPAITRANRFDLLLCVATPPWTGKRSADKLKEILKIVDATKVEKKLVQLVARGSVTEKHLDLFTVSEIGVFFDHLRRINNGQNLSNALNKYKNPKEFSKVVAEWSKDVIGLREGEPTKEEYDDDVEGSRRQYYRKETPKRRTRGTG
jgi:SpoVK/Ycf46/Vps4 family AAA+-type ATPase